MFDEINPDIAVINCYFGDLAKVSEEALTRSINVFTEKPVATTLEDLENLKAYERSKNIRCHAGIRYKPWFLAAPPLCGRRLYRRRLLNTQKSYKLGRRGENYKSREVYGGTIPWVGSHGVDWIRWFSREEFVSVYASHSSKHNRGHGDLEMTALCHFVLTNEIFASLTIDYFRPDNAPTHDDDRLRVVGTKGIVEVIKNKVLLIDGKTPGIREIPLESEGSIFLDFLKEVEGKGKCLVTAEDSFRLQKFA